MIFSTSSSEILRGAPTLGSSRRPSSRCSTNRLRHKQTVWFDVRHRRATSLLLLPAAHASMSLARNATFRFTRARCVRRTSSSRSSSDKTSGAFGRRRAFVTLLDHAPVTFSIHLISRGLGGKDRQCICLHRERRTTAVVVA